MPGRKLQPLYDILGHEFHETELLREALTHPSLDVRREGRKNYQRLEFLGDRVLGLVIAEHLLVNDVDAGEGDLAVRYNTLVRRETVADVARSTGLAPFLRLGKSEEERGGREKPAILADACEAVIGAVYLDGGLEVARAFILKAWGTLILQSQSAMKDAKTRLQELVQARDRKPPKYKVRDREGPDHAPVFTVEVTIAGAEPVAGRGGSRREAEQAAAEAMLRELGEDV